MQFFVLSIAFFASSIYNVCITIHRKEVYAMFKKITGSWFEFTHHNIPEGKYLNPVCRHFSDEQWEAKIAEMAHLGMKYLVLTCSALAYEDKAEIYFDSDIYPAPVDFACKNPMEVMFSAADKYDMKIFVSVGFYGPWTHSYENMTSETVKETAFGAMKRMYELFGKHPSFYGWYYPDETCIDGHYDENFIKYCNAYSAHSHEIDPRLKTLIAPYGTCILKADDHFVDQLKRLDVDIVAYQDEIGVRKATTEQTGGFFKALREAHDKAGRSALWADMELFEFEGDVYHSALIPAAIERLEKQIEAISPYVDEILTYEYIGIMNEPGTIAYAGHPDSVDYYRQYERLLKAKGVR